jgi:acyl dehydratase
MFDAAAVSMRLFIDTMQVEGGIIGRAIDELRWPAAVHPGDRIQVKIEILEARLFESKPGRGLLRYRSLTKKLDDKGWRVSSRWQFYRRVARPIRNQE